MKPQEVALAASGETPEAADSQDASSGAWIRLTKTQKQEIFRALVEAQDQGMPVPQSKKVVAERFGISDAQLRRIEEEGVDQEWPPL